ncbi:TAXI family TRAP transporter solute-binding subunit [Sediminispirochaeta bajacaliforniensis]|uniref:TAXI family TRAP transporter solute-binding subunit n=1 Tax=Sediminispirochaeta bajacaliforniensis TaxID=148 RepID=UPI0003603D9D|nr:TAXI family TRAP transporter solute-binding subunit [Sediminispirochaeta bajacaliforniensis]
MKSRKNKILVGIVLCALLVSFPLFASGQKDGERRNIIIGAGGAGGSWYLLAAQISEILKTEMPDVSVSVIEGGAISNVRLTNEGRDLDVGMASLPNVIDALDAKGVFAEDGIDNISAIMNFAVDYVQFTVLADSGITEFGQLGDKRILPGPKGWGIEALTGAVCNLYGFSYDSIKANGGSVSFVSWGEAPSLLKDGHADMAAFKGAVPNSNVMEIDATNKARIIGLSKEQLDQFLAENLGYFKGTIKAGTYRGQDSDALTIGHTSVFFANNDLPEELVYQLTKAILENKDKLNQIEGVEIGDDALLGIDQSILHPGARRYYKEIGLIQ